MDDSAPDGSKRHVNERIDVRVGVERRRRWGRENKLSIVRESLAPNAVVTEVARRHEISAGLLYTWRKQALAGLLGCFMPVRVVANAEQARYRRSMKLKTAVRRRRRPWGGRAASLRWYGRMALWCALVGTSMVGFCALSLQRWRRDDWAASGDARLSGLRRDGYAPRV